MLHVAIGTDTDDYETLLDASISGKPVASWVVPKSASPDDDVIFFVRAFGLVATGTVLNVPEPGTFGKRSVYRADVGSCTLLAMPVPIDHVRVLIPEWAWPTYPRTHITVPEGFAKRLTAVLCDYQDGIGGDAAPEPANLSEGHPHRRNALRYERNAAARNRCILIHGARCAVCKFEFGATYGAEVNGLILVHHLVPLATMKENYVVNSKTDLRPVCANCHLVMHRRDPPYTIAEVKRMLRAAHQAASDSVEGT